MTLVCRIIEAGFDSTIRSTIWTGRPLRAAVTPYIRDWESTRRSELEGLLSKGTIPIEHEYNEFRTAGGLSEEVQEQSVMRYATSVFPVGLCVFTNCDFSQQANGNCICIDQ